MRSACASSTSLRHTHPPSARTQRLAAEEEAAAAAAAAQEAERVARLREEYEAAVPEEIKERVDTAVTKELAAFKEQLEQQQRELLARLDSVAPAAS